jgi:23S rRNA (cytidine1920-2'-O)/16S rRNA (cytidine1409-2'-O)-methyltransferase
VAGRRALDVGASTGGFTDCLLQRGAVEVVAVDVGHGQLHERLRADARVVNRERTNVRWVEPGAFGGTFPIVVADLSFISLRTVVPVLLEQAEPGADLVLLVKPQFEAGKAEVSRGRGVVADPVIWRRTVDDVQVACIDAGAAIMGAMVSPLRGADGNVEFLLHVSAPDPTTGSAPDPTTGSGAIRRALGGDELDRLVAVAVDGPPEPT